ncbi:TPA: hypothetical protein NGR01_003625 [Vibrio parahaemolyticus]|uniref:hypothetical protein n=1 Tax=Vibrio parahaemolyticus TaxID=670 RepID=UPI00112303F6|nr:hypothetical protein [Vibrio parahaemolyticus]EJG0897479.1 hypothetical protein [Vibrio parahaemolyticus]EJG0993665.1 hypothetical protein [Vibrio parahaemolyticus]EJG1003430.1 hypothetical protein [Vibrio parahaemolyticus]EJG1051522.1 hypothetical protein [Vibrio parahaemolyticus]TPA59412.1 hypothetical protein DXJ81_20285 [Vibrio parahaemolyticus]
MQNYSVDSIINLVLNSTAGDWQHDANTGIYVFKHDVRLNIKPEGEYEEFNEPWVTAFPNPNASRAIHSIYFDNIKIKEYFLVSVDGGRAYLPLPHSATNLSVTHEQYSFAHLVHYAGSNCLYSFEDYFKRAGLVVA